MPFPLRHRVRATLLSALVAAAVIAPRAQARPDTPASIQTLVQRLADVDFKVRDGAERELTTRGDLSLSDFDPFLKRTDLTPEQRLRLVSAARERFMRSPRAAMGIQFDGPFEPPKVVVRRVEPHFPAAKVLEAGDVLLEADGEPLGPEAAVPEAKPGDPRQFNLTLRDPQSTKIRSIIISREPGDVMTIKIVRKGQEMEVRVPLGRFADLVGGQLQPRDLSMAWAKRMERFEQTNAEPIAAPVTRDQWRMDGVVEMEREALSKRSVKSGVKPELFAGGRPRGGLGDPAGDAAMRLNGGRVQVMPDGRVIRQGAMPSPQIDALIRQLSARRDEALREIRVHDVSASNPQMTPEQRESHVAQAANKRAVAQSLQQMIDDLRRQLQMEQMIRP